MFSLFAQAPDPGVFIEVVRMLPQGSSLVFGSILAFIIYHFGNQQAEFFRKQVLDIVKEHQAQTLDLIKSHRDQVDRLTQVFDSRIEKVVADFGIKITQVAADNQAGIREVSHAMTELSGQVKDLGYRVVTNRGVT